MLNALTVQVAPLRQEEESQAESTATGTCTAAVEMGEGERRCGAKYLLLLRFLHEKYPTLKLKVHIET